MSISPRAWCGAKQLTPTHMINITKIISTETVPPTAPALRDTTRPAAPAPGAAARRRDRQTNIQQIIVPKEQEGPARSNAHREDAAVRRPSRPARRCLSSSGTAGAHPPRPRPGVCAFDSSPPTHPAAPPHSASKRAMARTEARSKLDGNEEGGREGRGGGEKG